MATKTFVEYSNPVWPALNGVGRRARFGAGKLTNALRHFWLGGLVLLAGIEGSSLVRAGDAGVEQPSQVLTNVGQFRVLPIRDFLRGCSFHLVGTVTLVDTNRSLLVLQDATGAVAVNLDMKGVAFRPGQLVSVEGEKSSPYVASFPDYPRKPSGWDVRNSFEAPSNWGDYHLTRMRGHLHPPVTGDYTFWIASDNSGELWLSPDDDPTKIRRIAFVREWVNPHDWSHEPSQRSETYFLRADQAYYIEAFEEQQTLDDHLSVAWQGPGLKQGVIDGRYLTPWIENLDQAPFAGTKGVLREYWTNYFNGTLVRISGPRHFDSALGAEKVRATILGQGTFPVPKRIALNQQLPPEDQYRWVETEGTISFAGKHGESAILEMTDGQGRAQVRLSNWKGSWPTNVQSWQVRVQGVCEGARNLNGLLTLNLIWASTESGLSFIEPPTTHRDSLTSSAFNTFSPTNSTPVLGGFYFTRGVVTFNDRVFGKDCLFVQEKTASSFISQEGREWGRLLRVGQSVEVGGFLLLPGKYAPVIRPEALTVFGWGSMPEPAEASMEGNKDGRWTELEGVVRSVNSDGSLSLMGRRGADSVWIGQVSTNELSGYVDSTLRVRGVMSLALLDGPLLLSPSSDFVQVEEEPPANPFQIPSRSIASVAASDPDIQWVHRVRIAGVVSYKNARTLFVQDASGAARVQCLVDPALRIGQAVEIVGFPETDTPAPTLTEALVRPAGAIQALSPRKLDLNEIAGGGHDGVLISMKANLLSQKTTDICQVLKLQEGEHVFEALLATNQGRLRFYALGSRLEITGICDSGFVAPPLDGKAGVKSSPVRSLRIWLRDPTDVTLLKGPPWWTLKGLLVLAGVLTTLLSAILVWNNQLRRQVGERTAQLEMEIRSREQAELQRAAEAERLRIARDLHDDLGSGLTEVSLLADAGLGEHPGIAKQTERFRVIADKARGLVAALDVIVWAVNPKENSLQSFADYLSGAMKEFLAASGVTCRFKIPIEFDEVTLSGQTRHHLFLAAKEALNNVVRHARATEVELRITRTDGQLEIAIADNGCGFDAMTVCCGNGLANLRERLKGVGGRCDVETQPGKGTTVKLILPVQVHPLGAMA
jgi:signal transduction histidine kinase